LGKPIKHGPEKIPVNLQEKQKPEKSDDNRERSDYCHFDLPS